MLKDMEFKDKLTKAILKGIDEAFDIDDLDGITIEEKPAEKKKIDKHSKMYKEAKAFIDAHPIDKPARCYRKWTQDELDFARQLYEGFDDFDPETKRLIMRKGYRTAFPQVHFYGRKLFNRANCYDLVWEELTKNIDSKKHPLYAFYKPQSNYDFGQLARKSIGMRNLNWIDTSDITNMSGLCRSFPNDINISLWDVSNVTDMSHIFMCSEFNGDISKWDVSKVRNMSHMFYESSFEGDISKWDVSNVEDMSEMFGFNKHFQGDISKWDVRNVKDMSWMFRMASFNRNISKWDVSNVKDMSYMFIGSDFNQDIRRWNVSKDTKVNAMFTTGKFDKDVRHWGHSLRTMFDKIPFNQPDTYPIGLISGKRVRK